MKPEEARRLASKKRGVERRLRFKDEMTCDVQEPEKEEARWSASNRRGAERRLRLKEDTTIAGQETSKAAHSSEMAARRLREKEQATSFESALVAAAINNSRLEVQLPVFSP